MMCKRLTRAALFILCATLPLGISAAYQNAKDGDITAGNILWVQPSELSPNYRANSNSKLLHPVIILGKPSDLAKEMVPVACLTHYPFDFLPSEPETRYGLPANPLKDKKTGVDIEGKVILVKFTINYKSVFTNDKGGVLSKISDDNLKKLLSDIDDKAKERIRAGSCVLTWVKPNGLPDMIPKPSGQDTQWLRTMQLSTNAIILSDLNADGTVSIAEVRVVNGKLPASFITNPGSKYGLPGPTKALPTNLNLQVIMAKKRVPYSRIFPLSETKNNAWKLSGHTLSSVKLELLNKDISNAAAT